MRADRLLSILLLLQVRERLTARELAERLEVSPRTIYRDMDALSAAGIPVVAERGAGGGWALLEGYRTNLTGLNLTEIQALFLPQSAPLLGDLGLHQAWEAALLKLLAALPSVSRRNAEFVRQRIHVDGAGWHQAAEDVPFLPTLQEALWQERKLHLAYQRSDRTQVERLVDPLGLVVKGRIWYLVAAVEGELRTYRVSRVQGARLAGEPCAWPRGYDLAAYWEESVARFREGLPRYPAVVRARAETVEALGRLRYVRLERQSPPDAGGWVTVSVQFETEKEACQYVLGFGPRIEVLEPEELWERVRREAEGVVAMYGG